MSIWRLVEKLLWESHPFAQGVRIKPLISEKNDGINVTCMLVQIPKGKEVPEHIHDRQDDILYPIKGKGVIWVEGSGSYSLEPGVVVRVPKGTKHKIVEIKEELLLYDVFSPALI